MCGFCGKLNKENLCKKCENKLNKESNKTYLKIEDKYFDEQIYYFKYDGDIRKNVIDYKFNEKSYLYKSFVKFVINDIKTVEILKIYDIIIPVPISKKRNKQRGFNQSELIAKELVKQVNKSTNKIELNCDSLYKNRNIIEQSKLNKEERIKNIHNVYKLQNIEKIENKNILLIDDIYTTGSTLNECSRILKQAKPSKVGILTIAMDEINKE